MPLEEFRSMFGGLHRVIAEGGVTAIAFYAFVVVWLISDLLVLLWPRQIFPRFWAAGGDPAVPPNTNNARTLLFVRLAAGISFAVCAAFVGLILSSPVPPK